MKNFFAELINDRFMIAAVLLFGLGFMNLLLQKNLIKKIIGFNVMDSSIFLFLASQGYINGRIAPIITNGVFDAEVYINPIPSGLVLTGIVVSVSVTAFFLALTVRLYGIYKTVDFDEIMLLINKEAE